MLACISIVRITRFLSLKTGVCEQLRCTTTQLSWLEVDGLGQNHLAAPVNGRGVGAHADIHTGVFGEDHQVSPLPFF